MLCGIGYLCKTDSCFALLCSLEWKVLSCFLLFFFFYSLLYLHFDISLKDKIWREILEYQYLHWIQLTYVIEMLYVSIDELSACFLKLLIFFQTFSFLNFEGLCCVRKLWSYTLTWCPLLVPLNSWVILC